MSIEAMKQALEALETDPCKENAINNAQFFIKQAIAEAEKQEPVAWNGECVLGHCGSPSGCDDLGCCRADAAPVHAINMSQERVDETAKREHDLVGACVTCGAPHGFWLSAPPTNFISPSVVKAISKREWVGLTEEEVDQCHADTADEFQFYQVIEAKLKEKNT